MCSSAEKKKRLVKNIRERKEQKNSKTMLPANRVSKSRLFAMIFSEKENLLQIYNALKGTTYKESEQIKVNTLENAIYMSMHNDVSFLFGCFQELYEHQSTYNPNMPLRFLLYV